VELELLRCVYFSESNYVIMQTWAGKPDGFEIKMTETEYSFAFCF